MRAHYVHDALFHDSDDELVTVAAGFLAEGLERGEHGVVVCGDARNALIDRALSASGPGGRVSFIGQGRVYPRIAAAVAFYRRFVERAVEGGASGVRIVGEVPFGTDRARWAQWGRYEAVCNAALADLPLWSICAYDTRTVSGQVEGLVRLSHPTVRRGGRRSANAAYLDPVTYLSSEQGRPEAWFEWSRDRLTLWGIASGRDLRRARRRLLDVLTSMPVERGVADDLVTATTEVLINAVTHGRPPATLRLRSSGDQALCEVTDRGHGFDDPLVGYWHPTVPGAPNRSPSGLWLARQLVDDLTFRRSSAGFTVRLRTSWG